MPTRPLLLAPAVVLLLLLTPVRARVDARGPVPPGPGADLPVGVPTIGPGAPFGPHATIVGRDYAFWIQQSALDGPSQGSPAQVLFNATYATPPICLVVVTPAQATATTWFTTPTSLVLIANRLGWATNSGFYVMCQGY